MIIRYRTAGGGASQPSSLEERLAALEAAESVRGLLNRYARAVDAQDVAQLDALLAHDVQLSIGGSEIVGKNSVIRFFEDAFRDDPAPKHHFIMDVETRWLGTDGLVDSDCSFMWVAREQLRSVIGWGRYHHQARVSEGNAVFTRIRIRIDYAGDAAAGWQLET